MSSNADVSPVRWLADGLLPTAFGATVGVTSYWIEHIGVYVDVPNPTGN